MRRDYAADELSLASHGRKLVFGAFLSDIEKDSLRGRVDSGPGSSQASLLDAFKRDVNPSLLQRIGPVVL